MKVGIEARSSPGPKRRRGSGRVGVPDAAAALDSPTPSLRGRSASPLPALTLDSVLRSPDGNEEEDGEVHNTYEVAPCRVGLENLLRSKQGEHQVLSRQQRRIQLGGVGTSKAALVQQSPPSSWRPKVMILA